MSDLSKDDLLKETAEVFEETYPQARSLHLRHESLTGERSIQTLANFRDALDHMSRLMIFLNDENLEMAQRELYQVQDHLERVIYDGSKSPLERNLSYLEDHRLPYFVYRIALLEAPTNDEFNRRMKSIRQLYYEGRKERREQAFEDANDIAERLVTETPARREVVGRCVLLAGALISILYIVWQIV